MIEDDRSRRQAVANYLREIAAMTIDGRIEAFDLEWNGTSGIKASLKFPSPLKYISIDFGDSDKSSKP